MADPTRMHACINTQVRSMPVRKDDEVQVVRGTFKVRWDVGGVGGVPVGGSASSCMHASKSAC